ncbi:hypothetical protein HPP92_008414 [Vanilla planifolia]|uniref:DDHD domain-containing protein n=1 Tax=Vanilla planifolia TaxID=51239 RepID=A0A835R8B8_VANPL|nr:hypothetical protein HPP92_008414 [Vanilla planifolia]
MAAVPDQVEGASPDLLQNTPSNIAKLEDLIEQCKGRQKYLAQSRSPSDGEDVRWYFCKVPLAEKELAASVPQTEVVGKSDYFRFSVRDSLALEASFLQREEELLAYWWKEYAECNEGPKGSCSCSETWDDHGLYFVEEDRVGVPVKGGLYEVCGIMEAVNFVIKMVALTRRHCFPVYWNGENRSVLRGHWFARKGGTDWLPVWHRRTFQPSGLFAARVDLQGKTQGMHALFTGEDSTWEAWLVFDTSCFSFGRGNWVKLRRGFQPSGSVKPTQVPVGHLVFMVHGIGQRLEKANLVDDVGDFRRVTASLAERHLTPYQRSTQRVLFIPCQWRKGLKLSGESAVEKITLDGVRGLRVTLSATAHDVLYYMSPIYCQNIIDSVSVQLNKLYAKFLKRNPHYNGKVSLYGHSLGSVLSYDILCHQDCLTSPFAMDSVCMSASSEQEPQHNVSCQCHAKSKLAVPENEECAISSGAIEQFPCQNMENQPNLDTCGMLSIDSDINLNPDTIPPLNAYVDCLNSPDCSRTGDDSIEFVGLCLEKEQPANASFGVIKETKCSNANFDKAKDTSQTAEGGTADLLPEDIAEKDKLISFLKEEVKLLQTRIVALEQKGHSSLLENNVDFSKENFSVNALHTVGHCKDQSNLEKSGQDASRKRYTPYIRYTKLDFKVDTFFAVGSPLGVFLALRNIRIGIGRGQDYWQDENISEEMPACCQMFNIFHPFDPVAYRVEPLICKDYINKRPVIIPYHRGGRRLHIGFREFTEDVAARTQAVINDFNSLKVKLLNTFQSIDQKEEVVEDDNESEQSYGYLMIDRLTGNRHGRVDHVLQDKTFQHPYISALGSHTNYWRDHDTALFILKHLYRDIPEDTLERSSDSAPLALFYNKDFLDEDLPLTFWDHSLIREFSREAKKAIQYS